MINLKIITIDGVFFSGDVTEITLPTSSGQISILLNHVPLITTVIAGTLILHSVENLHTKKETISHIKISDGVLEIRPESKAFLLVHTAENQK